MRLTRLKKLIVRQLYKIQAMTPTHSIVSVGSQTSCVPRYKTMLIIVWWHVVHILAQYQLRWTASETRITRVYQNQFLYKI